DRSVTDGCDDCDAFVRWALIENAKFSENHAKNISIVAFWPSPTFNGICHLRFNSRPALPFGSRLTNLLHSPLPIPHSPLHTRRGTIYGKPTMPNPSIIQLSFPEADIALLTFDDPNKGANVLSSHVLAELSTHLDLLEKRDSLAGLIIRSGKAGSFIAGADL